MAAFSVGSKQILHPDGMIDINGKQKRRGGIPVLFPQAGALPPEQGAFKLDQHGFARDLPWETAEVSRDGRQAEFVLRANPKTREKYPFDFEVRAKIEISAAALNYLLIVRNPSSVPIPAAPGLHPYFAIPAGQWSRLRTNVIGFDIAQYRMDKSLILPPQRVDLEVPGVGRVSMIPGGDFLRIPSRLVVWSDRQDYMCFEPWAAGVGSLLAQKERLEVQPGQESKMTMRIEAAV